MANKYDVSFILYLLMVYGKRINVKQQNKLKFQKAAGTKGLLSLKGSPSC